MCSNEDLISTTNNPATGSEATFSLNQLSNIQAEIVGIQRMYMKHAGVKCLAYERGLVIR